LVLDLAGAGTEEEAAGRVRARAAGLAPGEWIGGRGWDQNRWPARQFPTRASLDQAAPRHPVALTRIDRHAIWANSARRRPAGIPRPPPAPAGGLIAKGPDGEPTGLLIDTAQRLVQAVSPRPSAERFEAAVREAIAQCLAAGLPGGHEMGAGRYAPAASRRPVERRHVPLRHHRAARGASAETWAEYRERGPEAIGDGRVVVGALKLVADGALGSRGAALHGPYCDDPENRGLLLLAPDELAYEVAAGAARGFQVCVHAIGDPANTLTLDAFA